MTLFEQTRGEPMLIADFAEASLQPQAEVSPIDDPEISSFGSTNVFGAGARESADTQRHVPQVLESLAVERQAADNWCWAATTAAVHNHYVRIGLLPGPLKSQAEIASKTLDHDCRNVDFESAIQSEDHTVCNVQRKLRRPLKSIGCWVSQITGKVTLDRVIKEIDLDRPICVRIDWSHGLGDGHFVVIRGYQVSGSSDLEPEILVDDSFYGPKTIPFDKFINGYKVHQVRGGASTIKKGSWAHTYPTQAPATS